MQSALEIRHRIAAVGQTKKITSAMQLVSSARTHSVMQHCDYYARYFNRLQAAMKEIIRSLDDIDSPYFHRRSEGRRAFIVISSDKGMAGSYNSSVLKAAYKEISACKNPIVISVGKVGERFFLSKGVELFESYKGLSGKQELGFSRTVMQLIDELYIKKQASEIIVFYTSFFGKDKAKPKKRRILPILSEDLEEITCEEQMEGAILHPNPRELFRELVPQYVTGLLYGVIIQSYASENFMRMISMQSATKNATELQIKLLIKYNMARQSAITQEITEITGASEILMKED
ncbi:MAG: ATP synthase F1 subunit gamma [Acutalibacteraceae bacterium]